jgi:hypothetical protein
LQGKQLIYGAFLRVPVPFRPTGGGEQQPDLGTGAAGLRDAFEQRTRLGRAALLKRGDAFADQAFGLLIAQFHHAVST